MKCPDCDRDDCPLLHLGEYPDTTGMTIEDLSRVFKARVAQTQRARLDCNNHRVDWRARAMAAEAQVAVAREAVTEWPEARHHRAFCGSLEIRPYGPRHACNCGVDKQNEHRMTALARARSILPGVEWQEIGPARLEGHTRMGILVLQYSTRTSRWILTVPDMEEYFRADDLTTVLVQCRRYFETTRDNITAMLSLPLSKLPEGGTP